MVTYSFAFQVKTSLVPSVALRITCIASTKTEIEILYSPLQFSSAAQSTWSYDVVNLIEKSVKYSFSKVNNSPQY